MVSAKHFFMCLPFLKSLENFHCFLSKGSSSQHQFPNPRARPLFQVSTPVNSGVRIFEILGLSRSTGCWRKGQWKRLPPGWGSPRVVACVKWSFRADTEGLILAGQREIALLIPGRDAVGGLPGVGPSGFWFPMVWPLAKKVTRVTAAQRLTSLCV